jgi:hypothetical protein
MEMKCYRRPRDPKSSLRSGDGLIGRSTREAEPAGRRPPAMLLYMHASVLRGGSWPTRDVCNAPVHMSMFGPPVRYRRADKASRNGGDLLPCAMRIGWRRSQPSEKRVQRGSSCLLLVVQHGTEERRGRADTEGAPRGPCCHAWRMAEEQPGGGRAQRAASCLLSVLQQGVEDN